MRTSWRAVACALSLGASCAPCIGSGGVQAQGTAARLGAGTLLQSDAVRDSTRRPDSVRAAERHIDVELRDVPLKDALKSIAGEGGVVLFYNDRDIPARKRVTIALKDVPVSDAVREVLRGTAMTVRVTERGIVIERRSTGTPAKQRADTLGSISGSVVDSATGEAVVGVGVTLIGTTRGASTDANGDFRITGVTVGRHTIVARRLGYRPTSLDVVVQADSDVIVRLSMVPAPKRLDQIVTTATGEQARKEVGNLIATIEADSVMASAPVTDISQLLAGRAAGVQVYFGSGLTGASPPINIRGQNSLSLSSQPLLIVDGVRVANSTTGVTTPPTYAGASSGRFDDLDPMQIESIEIVKGPSAATLYGTDAANGVIIVKTKRGQPGPPSWSAFAESGILTFDRDRFPTSYFPWGHSLTGSSTPSRCTLLAVAAGSCSQDSVTNFSPLRDVETTPIGDGDRYRVGLQLRGGTPVQYFLSATLESETGYLKMPDADRALLEAQAGRGLTSDERHPNAASRYSVRGNFTVPIAGTLDIDFNAALSRADIRIPDPGAILFGGVSTGTRDANDGWTLGLRAGDYLIKRDREQVTHLMGGVTLRWHPRSWLSGRLTTGLDLSTDYMDRLVPAGLGFSASTLRGSRENTKVNSGLQTVDAGLSASVPLGSALTSRTSIGAQYNRRSVLSNTAAAQDMVPGAETVSGGAVPMVSESTIESVVGGAYLEQTLGWRDRLYLTGAVRVDGASSFGSGFKAAVYPKASVSWLLSEEPFWPDWPAVSSVRVRAAYGESGVQPGPVVALPAETLFPVATAAGAATGARLGALGNRSLRPERQREFEGGVDVEILDGRIGLQATYYDKRSSDALVAVALPSSLGGGSQWQNVGAVRNRGYEGVVHAHLLATQGLDWDLTLSGSINDNTVLAIAPGLEAIYNTGTILPSLVPGYPLKSYFDYPIEGVTDADGDGIIVPSEIVAGDEPRFAGAGYPRTQVSASTTIGLFRQRLIVSGMVEHRGGYVIANIAESLRCVFGACSGAAFQGADFAGQAANVARGAASLHNTYWGYYEDGTFTRLRELSLTYNLSRSVAAALRVRSASITLSGRNLALWTSYSGTDPEIQSQPGAEGFPATFDRTGIPAPTYWLLRVNLGF